MRSILTFIQWLLVGLTTFLVFIAILLWHSLALFCFLVALLIIFPPLKPLLTAKLPFLQKRIVKSLAWLILVITGMIFWGSSFPTVSNLVICTQIQQDICPTETTDWVKNGQNIYLSGEQENLDDGTEFTVIFKSKSDSKTEPEVARQIVKAKVKEETFLLELDPNNLPGGTYQVSLANDDVTLPDSPVKDFTIWAGEVKDLTLCSQLEQNVCSTETTKFVKNEQKLYLSGNHKFLKNGTEFIVDLNYFPEPEKKTKSEQKIVKTKVNNQKFLLELNPKDLPIGTYDLKISSDKVKFAKDEDSFFKKFTVWDSEEDIPSAFRLEKGEIVMNNLPLNLTTSPKRLSLCDRSNLPLPKIPSNNESQKEQEAETVIDDPTFCQLDSTQLSSKTTAIGFRLTFGNSLEEQNKLKIVWKYRGRVISKNVVRLSGKAVALNYTLSSPEKFPLGNYELILALEALNAQPIYRQFSVK